VSRKSPQVTKSSRDASETQAPLETLNQSNALSVVVPSPP
jgi:hypothetical protein